MKTNRQLTLLAALLAVTALASCNDTPVTQNDTYTYYDYTTVSPSNWNELTYQDNNDTQVMSYIGSSFFTFDFKFDANGEILPGEFDVEYQAATALEDVTTEYAGDEKWGIPASATENRAYKITLRNDLKWDDGTAIKAEDFVYTMAQQLDPDAKHYRADSFYNSGTVIHNAKNYVYQGSTQNVPATDKHDTWEVAKDDASLFFSVETSYIGNWIATKYGSYLKTNTPAWVLAALGCPVAEADILSLEGKTIAEINASAELKAIWEGVLGWWQTEPNEELHFWSYEYTFPKVEPTDLGIFVGENEYELVIVLDKGMELLNEDGSLYYNAAYQLSSLPLVHKAKWEANYVAKTEDALAYSTYNTSVASTASWGPYKLTEFQSGKQYTLERNENWFGYDLYPGQYQTDKIVVETIAEYNTAMLKFEAGELSGIGIDVSVADKYKNSSQAVFTPSDFVGSMQLQSNVEALKARETDGINKSLLGYVDFRKAISLGMDRNDFAKKCTTASLAGFGLFNSMHYYDVANGGVFRNTDEAKQVLCDTYAVDSSKFDSLDEAVDSITGYDLVQARQLLEKAVAEAKAAGDYKEGDVVKLTVGTAEDTVSTRRVYEYIKGALENLAVGTSLEGKLTADFDTSFGDEWSDDFRDGKYDICTGGWSGAAWDPGYFLLAYLSPDYMYSMAWDTSATYMTYKVKGVTITNEKGEEVVDPELSMSLMDWYDCLNGNAGCKYDWSDASGVDTSVRLGLIAALEGQVLQHYYSVPLYNSYSAALMSYKHDYITREYNTFVGYGGLKYLTYNYTDAEWAEYVKNNTLNYEI